MKKIDLKSFPSLVHSEYSNEIISPLESHAILTKEEKELPKQSIKEWPKNGVDKRLQTTLQKEISNQSHAEATTREQPI